MKNSSFTKDASKLTERQKRFAEEYLIDLNATAAYKRAGYAGKGNGAEVNASRLLSNTKVQQYVQFRMDKRSEDLGIDANYVLAAIKSTMERCQQAEPVMVFNHETKAMEPSGEYKFDSMAVLKGADLLGKHLKMFTDKIEHSGPDGGAIQIAAVDMTKLTEAELAVLTKTLGKIAE